MPLSNDQNNIPPPLKEPVTVHRAFIYSACAPGWGDIYAGSRLRGYAALFLFLFDAATARGEAVAPDVTTEFALVL